jgi:type I restriction enzyme R subunit
MIGRGTRKGERHTDKSHFVVFDCFDGTLLEFFKNCTGVTSEPPENPGRTIEQVIGDIWANRDRAYNVRCLVRRLQRIEKEITGEGRADFIAFGIPDGDIGRYAAQLAATLANDFSNEMRRLRNPDFQRLLVEYQRREKVFIIAPENEDTVSSEYLLRDAAGQQHTAAAFLTLFTKFVKDNALKIEPLRILLHEPKQWSAAALQELGNALAATPERFTADRLQLAHSAHSKKEKVDIISAVKHAAKESEPLLTAAERVGKAFDKLAAGKTFTAVQQAWLDRIRGHLVANLTIEQGDFDAIPVLSDPGGWGAANRVFDGKLEELVQALNEALAA